MITEEEILSTALATYALPNSVIATRNRVSDNLSKGSDRDIHHNYWLIRTENEMLVRNPDHWVRFNDIVDRGNVRLSDPECLADLLTKKILILEQLQGGGDADAVSAKSAVAFGLKYDEFVAWRRSFDIASNAHLNKTHFERYKVGLKSGKLLPLVKRVNEFFDQIAPSVPPVRYVLGLGGFAFNWKRLSHFVGIPSERLWKDHEVRQTIIARLKLIDDEHCRSFAKKFETEGKTSPFTGFVAGSLKGYIKVWSILDNYSKNGRLPANGLKFNPFREGSARQLYEQIAVKDAGQTPTLHPDDFIRLVSAATAWAFKNSGYIIAATAALRANDWADFHSFSKLTSARLDAEAALEGIRPVDFEPLSFKWSEVTDNGRKTIPAAMRALVGAVLLITGCYGARRRDELANLRTDCIERTPEGNIALKIYIEKTHRNIASVPVPKVVGGAIDMLRQLVSQTQSLDTPRWLFEISYRSVNDFISPKPTNLIREFIRYAEIPPPAGADEWEITSHMLRRGFAVFYYHGFENALLDPLVWMLWHYDPEMTRVYVRKTLPGEISRLREQLRARQAVAKKNRTAEDEKEILEAKILLRKKVQMSQDFLEVKNEAFAYKLLKAHLGQETVLGKGARKFYANVTTLAKMAAADVRVTSRSNNLEDFKSAFFTRAKKWVSNKWMEPVPGGVMHCSAEPDNDNDLATAECLKLEKISRQPWKATEREESREPNFAFSGAYPCIQCVHGCAFNANQQVLAQKGDTLRNVSLSAATPAAQANAEAIYEEYMAEFNAMMADKVDYDASGK
ncbi:site-specific integrase [Rhizobium laguerreae]|uniref:hypothetical protein n=1 Tax=Rhizobium laguerreae TaxID=1076926 RepID=UPI001C901554|nr:hypothetical protein [Rhizobium laguerreae]MBY3198041.1 hypothetical protein [Rhizobium laguerreae]